MSLFNSALKISWLKRLLPQTTGWAVFPIHFNIHILILYGNEFARRVSRNTGNQFWSDVAECVYKFLQCLKIKNTYDLHNTPLWHNSVLNLQYRSEWSRNGFTVIKDILNEEGKLFTMAELSNMNLRINFLEYETLKFNYQQMSAPFEIVNKTLGPEVPLILSKIGFMSSGCSNTYKILLESDNFLLETIQNKWSATLNEVICLFRVERVFENLRKVPVNQYTKYILFKLLHARIVTNQKLIDMELKDDPSCPYCNTNFETLVHAFINCAAVKEF